MIALVRSEFRKFFTTRTWWGMAIGVAVVSAAFALLLYFLLPGMPLAPGLGTPSLDDPGIIRTIYTGGLSINCMLTMLVGVLTIGGEYRHKTITSTFLATPKRERVVLSKIIALLGFGAFYGIVAVVGAVAVAGTLLAVKGHSPIPDASVVQTLAMMLLVLGLWALFGLGLGVLISNQLAAMVVAVGFAWIAEPLLGLALAYTSWGKGIAPYLPSRASSAMVQQLQQSVDPTPVLSWWAGALVLVAYAAVLSAVGTLLTLRRDVS